ncbi:Dual specificity tyrosine-phosphorylation-regulated kinase 2, partial [Fasciola hepatica]
AHFSSLLTGSSPIFFGSLYTAAVNRYGKNLTAFERQEVESYSEIWFLGLQAEKIHGIPGAPLNAGYDDEHGSYLKVTNDHLAYRYEVLETLGKGSFGRVVRAKDHRTGNFVAVKIIRNKKRFHQQAQIEVTVLEELKKVDSNNSCHIIHIRDHFVFRDHLCIVFDLMGQNLYEVLKKNDFRGFTMHSLRKIATKLLSCLCALRKRGIIHCDLKPENILIGTKNSSDLCVIDFGSSCYTNKRVYTYIQSRFYRAPEIILGLPYGTPIDIWSFGCILPELFTGRPLFPGENENEQLACIMEVFGQPPENILEKANRRRIFFDSKGNPRNLVNSKGRKRLPGCRTLQELVKSSDPKFLDLIQQCLRWNPDERITPEVALNHDWFREVTSQAKC